MEQQTIKCAFCGGSGRHPYYLKPLCPVCKGKGENVVTGEVQRCKYCKGSGRKLTTTLTCYYCGGLGVVYSHRPSSVMSLTDSGVVRQETAVIERIPVSGILREEKEMKAYVEPISGVWKESAIPFNHAVASLKDINKKEQVAGLTKVDQGYFENTVALLTKMKKERGEKRWKIQK